MPVQILLCDGSATVLPAVTLNLCNGNLKKWPKMGPPVATLREIHTTRGGTDPIQMFVNQTAVINIRESLMIPNNIFPFAG